MCVCVCVCVCVYVCVCVCKVGVHLLISLLKMVSFRLNHFHVSIYVVEGEGICLIILSSFFIPLS